MSYAEIESEYAEVRLPEAYRWAVAKSKEAELLIYQIITVCLERFEDVAIQLDRGDVICKFLRGYKNAGFFSGNALRFEEDEVSSTLSCEFDLYKIRDDLDVINDQFGTINFSVIEGSLESCNINIAAERVASLEHAIQKVKCPGKISIEPKKKDN